MYLLDTHTLLWFFTLDGNLSDNALRTITNSESVYVSIATLWEIAIKQSIGKLEFDDTPIEVENECKKQEIEILQIHPKHLDAITQLPNIHNDPFDRLLIAQAMTENMKLITKDGKIAKYDIETVW